MRTNLRRAAPALLVALWLGILAGVTYNRQISSRYVADRVETVDWVLTGKAKADYVYAMYAIARFHKVLASQSILTAEQSFAVVDFAGLLCLFLAAAVFLLHLGGTTTTQILGLAWIGLVCPLMFQRHYYHPSDFYGTALMFMILTVARKDRPYVLGFLCLVSGLLWEKALFVPAIYFVWIYRQIDFRTAVVRTWPAWAATTACLLFWRLAFPEAARESPYADWGAFFKTLPDAGLMWLLWTAPIEVALIDVFRSGRAMDRFWCYWLLYVPLLIGVIAIMRGHLGELRSFWILQPIFVGLLASWADGTTEVGPRGGKVNSTK